jgi:ribosomal protein S11
MSAVHLSYHQRQDRNKRIKYCELLNFLNTNRKSKIRFKLRTVVPKSKFRSKYMRLKYKNPRRRLATYKKRKTFRLINRQFFSRRLINRKLRRNRFKRRKLFGFIRLQKTTHNLFISLHSKKGALLYSSSICALGSKGKRERFGLVSLRLAGEKLAKKLHDFGLHRVNIHVRCFLTRGLRNLIWSLGYNKIRIYQILNFVKIAHGFMTLPARRRMKRRKIR